MTAERNPFENIVALPSRGIVKGTGGGGGVGRAPQGEPVAPIRVVRHPAENTTYAGDKGAMFQIQRGKETIGEVSARRDGHDIFVDWIGSKGPYSGAGALGPKHTREVLTQLRRYFPEAKAIAGDRVSGARQRTTEGRGDASVPLRPDIATPAQPPPPLAGTRQRANEAHIKSLEQMTVEGRTPQTFQERRGMQIYNERAYKQQQEQKAQQQATDDAWAAQRAATDTRYRAAQDWMAKSSRPREVTPELRSELLEGRRLGASAGKPMVNAQGYISQQVKGGGDFPMNVTTNPLNGASRVSVPTAGGPVSVPFASRAEALSFARRRQAEQLTNFQLQGIADLQRQRLRIKPGLGGDPYLD